MKKSLLILLAILLVGTGFAQKAPTTKLISSSKDRIVVNVQLNGYSTIRVQTPRGEQVVVAIPETATTLEAGAPELPMFPIPAIIGDMAEMTVNVIDAQYTDVQNIDVAPSKGNFSRQIDPADVPFTYGAMYDEDAFYPAAQATLEAPYILRDFRGQNIMVHPIAYNPQTHTLRVYNNLTIEMVKVSDNGENPKAARKSNTIKISPEQKGAYARRFINFEEGTKDYPFLTDNGEMLIICADPYMAGMEELVTWKNISGRPTTMVSVTEAGGNNDTQIKNYINSFYTDPNHNLAYVLFVGDYADLTPHSLGSERSDNWFGQLEGTDHYPEVFIGRFSVQTDAQVATHVNKVIGYERDVQAGITWGDKGMGIGYYGAGSGHYGEDDYQHIDKIRDTLLHYTYSTVTEHHGGSGGDASVSTISGTINQGISIINYCNHGSETSWGVANYSTSNVHALTNDNMLPIVWSVACLNGKFNYGSECFAEAWMRATNNSNGAPTGAIGGMFSWMSQPWIPPMYGQDEMVAILAEWRHVDQFYHTLGGASLNGNMNVIDKSGSSGYDTHDTWILFGDPSLMMRTANPTEMDVTVSPAAPMIGMSSLTISTDATCGVATLSKDGEVLATGQLVDGAVELNFTPFDNVGTYDLIILGYNKVTYVGTLEVLPAEGAYVAVDAFTPGNVPVNEEQLMSITFKNVGVDATTGTTNVVLSSEDTNITFNDNEGSFGVLAPDATITLEDEFSFTIASGVADGTKIQIDVTATCGSEVWTGKAKITVGAPIVVFDSFQGGSFTPGESQNVIANFRNDGHYMATNAVVTVTSTSQYVTFSNNTFEMATIGPESTVPAVFNFTIADNCPVSEVITLEFTLVADNEVMATGTGTLKNTCNVVFNLLDSYGDGWNGNQLTVAFSDGSPTQNLTFSSGSSATFTLEIGIGVHVTLGWINGSYTSECSFTVAYEGGDQITTGSNLSGSYHFEFDVNCGSEPIIIPANPVTELDGEVNVADLNVTLTWTAPDYALYYIVKRDGEVVANELVGTTYIDEDPLAQATYCVIAVYPGGEESVEACVEVLYPLGVEESESNFHIYPNPVNSTLYIQSGDTEYSYFMFNGMGQQVANGNAKGTATINVSNMTKGVYFLRITTGNSISTKKVVVE